MTTTTDLDQLIKDIENPYCLSDKMRQAIIYLLKHKRDDIISNEQFVKDLEEIERKYSTKE